LGGTTLHAMGAVLHDTAGRTTVSRLDVSGEPRTAHERADRLRDELVAMSGPTDHVVVAGVMTDSIAGPAARAVNGIDGPRYPRRVITELEDRRARCRRVERPYRFVEDPADPRWGLGTVVFGPARVTRCNARGYWTNGNPSLLVPVAELMRREPVRVRRRLDLDSYGSGFATVGRFWGTITVREHVVAVVFDSLLLHYRTGTEYQRPVRLDSITASVSLGDSTWTTIEDGRALSLGRSFRPGDTVRRGPTRFVIRHQDRGEDACHWITVTVFETILTPLSDGYTGPSWSYTHSRRGVLVPASRARECRYLR
jgi:hypothetical protein